MAQTTTVILIPTTAHPGSTGTGAVITGVRQQAAAYYLANRDLQTITWSVHNSFQGTVKIYASLVTDPGTDDWFFLYEADASTTSDGFHNITGNFIWLRCVVTEWTQGSIFQITASY